ncbi:Kae1-associated serine/threonine protein kinase [Candidatus Woesearchaeota archaeon]|nr:Kae1-associated serine/threonine protein kinase [Candidatus Woesearchaeota archaeon]
MNSEILGSGAEAIIKRDGEFVIKERIRKDYRLDVLDNSLRKFRTRREEKILRKLEELNFASPKVHDINDKLMTLRMDFINGEKLRDVLFQDPLNLGREIGKKIAILHKNDIVHGDLTTSNMILDNEVKFIDFGLSQFSAKVEDKAVDLHLFKHALESKHHKIWDSCFKEAIDGYKEENPDSKEILKRLEEVELRGRNKH